MDVVQRWKMEAGATGIATTWIKRERERETAGQFLPVYLIRSGAMNFLQALLGDNLSPRVLCSDRGMAVSGCDNKEANLAAFRLHSAAEFCGE